MVNLIVILGAYLLGNFSTSYIVAKMSANIDIRQHGSGNAGTTNVLRTLGKKAAAITFLGDFLKGVIAAAIIRGFAAEHVTDYTLLVAGVAVIVGHNWPVFLGFKGGKGIATSIGVVLMVKPLIALICLAFGIAILYQFRYVSLASISAMALLPLLMAFQGTNYFIFAMILSVLAIFKHRDNIKRLRAGTERKLGEKSSVK